MTANGSAYIIQLPKATVRPCWFSAAITTAFGGVPIGVAIPPMFAANGMQSAMPIRAGSPDSILAKIGMITVIIIAVVAVLLIKAERTAVTAIKPSIIVEVRLPKGANK